MRAAAYARYSTDKQTENSIAYQMERINDYCRRNSIDIVACYKDEAESGTNTENRASFLQLVADAKAKLFDCIIIYDISRGSRDICDWFEFRKLMRNNNITVISTEEHLGDILNPSDFLNEFITVGLGQHAVLQTRQKSIAGVAVKAKEGVFLGGYAPLGYVIKEGKYIIDETEAAAVRKIFELYAKGQGYNTILEAVKDVKGKRGQPLGKNSLHSILTNERYIGTYTWNKKINKVMRKWAGGKPNPSCVTITNAIPQIIDTETWERVRMRMSDNKRKACNKAKSEYLLSGMIECVECGGTFIGHTSTNKKGYKTRSYICGTKYRTKACKAHNVNADELEDFVVQQVKAYLLGVDFDTEAKKIADMVNGASVDVSAERQELTDINTKINNGVRAALNGLDIPELQDEIARLRIRKSELEDIIAYQSREKKKHLNPDDIKAVLTDALYNWDTDYKNIIRQCVTKIYAQTDGSFTVNLGVHIVGCGSRI